MDDFGRVLGVYADEEAAAWRLGEDLAHVKLVLRGAWEKTRRGNRFGGLSSAQATWCLFRTARCTSSSTWRPLPCAPSEGDALYVR